MPITYYVDEGRNFVHVQVTGRLTEQDLLQHTEQFLKDPRIKPGFRELFDATAASVDDVSKRTVDAILDLERQHYEKVCDSKTALVIQDDLGFDLAQEYERGAPGNIIVFFNVESAKAWLGHEGPHPESTTG